MKFTLRSLITLLQTVPKKMRLRSFKQQLLISIVVTIFAVCGILGGYMYSVSSSILSQETEKLVSDQLRLNAESIAEWRERVMEQLNGLAGQPAFVNNGSLAEQAALLQGYLSRNKDFLRFSILNLDGQGPIVDKNSFDKKVEVGSRDYFQTAKSGKTVISEPIISKADNSIIMNVTSPVYDKNGKVILVITGAISRDQIAAIVQRIKFAETGYAYLVNDIGDILAHPDSNKVMKENVLKTAATPAQKAEYEQILQKKEPFIGYTAFDKNEHLVGARQIPGTSWKLIMEAPSSELTKSIQKMFRQTLLIGAAILILGVIVAWWFGRMLSKGIIEISRAMHGLAGGDLNQHLSVKSHNEIGQLANDFNTMINNLKKLIGQISHNSEQVAATSVQLTDNSAQTSQASQEIAESIQQLADGSQLLTSGASESATAMEEMATAIQRIAESSSTMADAASHAFQESETGNESVAKVSEQMSVIISSVQECAALIDRLGSRSQEIGEIVNVISEISAQTNLLSLNAAIEAARAGEQGRGFAVVAQEVKKLAEQSATSASQIKHLIKQIQTDTELAVDAMKQNTEEVERGRFVVATAGEAFDRILKATHDVADQVQEVSAASEQMSASAEEVAASLDETAKISKESSNLTQKVSSITQEQLALMEEITSSAGNMSQMAQELKDLIKQFKM